MDNFILGKTYRFKNKEAHEKFESKHMLNGFFAYQLIENGGTFTPTKYSHEHLYIDKIYFSNGEYTDIKVFIKDAIYFEEVGGDFSDKIFTDLPPFLKLESHRESYVY